MQKVVLATGNAGKVRELASLLSDFGLDVVAQTELGVDSAEETGLTFIENAILKARHAAKMTGLPAIADDSGLAVDVFRRRAGYLFRALFWRKRDRSAKSGKTAAYSTRCSGRQTPGAIPLCTGLFASCRRSHTDSLSR